jgi:predicted nucleic-acid-binding protein
VSITVDTNVLVRALVRDDRKQAETAIAILRGSQVIVITLPCLCEFAWVLRSVYDFERSDIGASIERLFRAPNVVVDALAVEAGLKILAAGGDFADGVIAYEGSWLGGETFVSFDKKAVALLKSQGQKARLLA